MPVRLFVGNLTYDATEAELREFVSAAGTPVSVRILTDRETGKSRGFGFIEWSDTAEAEEAIRRLDQQVFKGRPLVVNAARAKEQGTGFSASGPGPRDRVLRPDQPARSFGPNAPPRGVRKPVGRGAKGERKPKGPIPERSGGQFFTEGADEVPGEAVDDTPFWLRPESDVPVKDDAGA